jgi:small subunit ribosomal protein S15
MSITKERKSELREQFSRHERDVGSSELQVAVLTERIRNLTEHLRANKKDASCKRGLLRLVTRRRKLLDYLKREQNETYRELIERLGLRR